MLVVLSERDAQVRRASVACALSVAWSAVAGATSVVAGLALVALAGAGAQSWWGWWWSNPVAALLIAAFLIREGIRTLRG